MTLPSYSSNISLKKEIYNDYQRAFSGLLQRLTYDSVYHVAHDLGVSLTWKAYNLSELPNDVSM